MTLSRHVDRMEAAGLVERRQDPNDRRARQLFTTEKSRELLAPMRARAAEVYDQAQAGLSPRRARRARRGARDDHPQSVRGRSRRGRRGRRPRPVGEGSRMNAQPSKRSLEEATPLRIAEAPQPEAAARRPGARAGSRRRPSRAAAAAAC